MSTVSNQSEFPLSRLFTLTATCRLGRGHASNSPRCPQTHRHQLIPALTTRGTQQSARDQVRLRRTEIKVRLYICQFKSKTTNISTTAVLGMAEDEVTPPQDQRTLNEDEPDEISVRFGSFADEIEHSPAESGSFQMRTELVNTPLTSHLSWDSPHLTTASNISTTVVPASRTPLSRPQSRPPAASTAPRTTILRASNSTRLGRVSEHMAPEETPLTNTQVTSPWCYNQLVLTSILHCDVAGPGSGLSKSAPS